MSWWLLLACVCALLLVLPMIPALLEWHQKRDALPLKVVRAYDGNIKHFANSFRAFLAERVPELTPGRAARTPLPGAPALREAAESYQLVGADGVVDFLPAELTARNCARMLIGAGPLRVSEGMLFEKELYAGAALSAGDGNSFRAILACGDITLGADCSVMRWAHSDAALTLGERAKLYGRVSAERAIFLQRSSRFGRMWAPLIRFGPAVNAPDSALPEAARQPLAKPHDMLDESACRWLVAGTLDIPAASSHATSLVSHQNIVIGEFSRIDADLKSNGDLRVGRGVIIGGALVAAGSIHIGQDCIIKGPVVGDRRVVIETGCVIGSPETPTTVTAAEIRIEEGVVAHGTVWARELGYVSAAHAEAA